MPEFVWATPKACDAPHTPMHPEQVAVLAEAFQQGWDCSKPALVGYRLDGRIQLLSGSHRHAAAAIVGLAVPVVVWPEKDVQEVWGDLTLWATIMGSGE